MCVFGLSHLNIFCFSILFLKDFYSFIFRQRGREREREGEKHQCVVASHTPSTGDLAHNPGMCPDWESNLWPFGSQACTQSTEPHQPGLFSSLPPSLLSFFSLPPPPGPSSSLIYCVLMATELINFGSMFSDLTNKRRVCGRDKHHTGERKKTEAISSGWTNYSRLFYNSKYLNFIANFHLLLNIFQHKNISAVYFLIMKKIKKTLMAFPKTPQGYDTGSLLNLFVFRPRGLVAEDPGSIQSSSTGHMDS